MLITTIEYDPTFSTIVIIIQILFFFEIIISCSCLDTYTFSFYFWLDLVSMLSMLLDIHWFYNAIVNDFAKSSASSIMNILRIIRLVRIIRFSKITKLGGNINDDSEGEKLLAELNLPNLENVDRKRIGKKLSESSIKRVIILVIAMILGIIIFDANFYYEPVNSIEFGITLFEDYEQIDDNVVLLFNTYIESHIVIYLFIFRILLLLRCMLK